MAGRGISRGGNESVEPFSHVLEPTWACVSQNGIKGELSVGKRSDSELSFVPPSCLYASKRSSPIQAQNHIRRQPTRKGFSHTAGHTELLSTSFFCVLKFPTPQLDTTITHLSQ